MAVKTIRVPFNDMQNHLLTVMLKHGFPQDKAELCADVITQSTCDGVVSHGLARFPRLLRQVSLGEVNINADPALIEKSGSTEYWEGNHGIGICNAMHAVKRAVEMAGQSGLSLVSLRNNTHWLRAGTYGWYAAEHGCALFCWTNTIPNMPAWITDKAVLGNNPLVIAIPNPDGHLVLDMAMSQFSYGKLDLYKRDGKELPYAGGFDKNGKFSKDPAAVLESGLPMPAGYWKGAALSIVLDILAASLSLGQGVTGMDPSENTISQVFLAVKMDSSRLGHTQRLIRQLVTNFKKITPSGDNPPRYPGQNIPALRRKNIEKGIPVPEKLWDKVRIL